MENTYDLLTQAASILDKAQNNLNDVGLPDLKHRLYDLRCELEDLREDVLDNTV